MKRFQVSLGSQLAAAFGDGQRDWCAVIKTLALALERGDSCCELSPDDIATVQAQSVVSTDGSQPFVLDGTRLYLQRYWQHEAELARRLSAMASVSHDLELHLNAFFDDAHQRSAAALALTRKLAIVTGGPGTGKTTTVVKILALLLMREPKLEIALAAPTGKAAMRLTESIANGKRDDQFVRPLFADHLDALDAVPEAGKTLHRLLGVRRGSPEFRHNASQPLTADLVVVDEASMVDLGLMSRLVQALKPSASLLLIGDQDQLASVEAGAVLADICLGLPDNRVHLQHTYRFDEQIKSLASAINEGETARVRDALAPSDSSVVCQITQDAKRFARAHYQPYWDVVAAAPCDTASVFRAFTDFQVLCATRADKASFDDLAPSASATGYAADGGQYGADAWYVGRPVMITENHAELGLFNGDIGICLPSQTGTGVEVFFPIQGEYRGFAPARLPAHETAYAMTIHKSQGSEFAHVLVLLPEIDEQKADTPLVELLSRELLYTAVTRAKKRVTLSASDAAIAAAVVRKIERRSGLVGRLIACDPADAAAP